MQKSKATVVFPPGLAEGIKLSLRDFMTQNHSGVLFDFRDDSKFRQPAVESLQAAPGSCGSIDGDEGLAREACLAGLHEALLREYRRIRPQNPLN